MITLYFSQYTLLMSKIPDYVLKKSYDHTTPPAIAAKLAKLQKANAARLSGKQPYQFRPATFKSADPVRQVIAPSYTRFGDGTDVALNPERYTTRVQNSHQEIAQVLRMAKITARTARINRDDAGYDAEKNRFMQTFVAPINKYNLFTQLNNIFNLFRDKNYTEPAFDATYLGPNSSDAYQKSLEERLKIEADVRKIPKLSAVSGLGSIVKSKKDDYYGIRPYLNKMRVTIKRERTKLIDQENLISEQIQEINKKSFKSTGDAERLAQLEIRRSDLKERIDESEVMIDNIDRISPQVNDFYQFKQDSKVLRGELEKTVQRLQKRIRRGDPDVSDLADEVKDKMDELQMNEENILILAQRFAGMIEKDAGQLIEKKDAALTSGTIASANFVLGELASARAAATPAAGGAPPATPAAARVPDTDGKGEELEDVEGMPIAPTPAGPDLRAFMEGTSPTAPAESSVDVLKGAPLAPAAGAGGGRSFAEVARTPAKTGQQSVATAPQTGKKGKGGRGRGQ